MSHQKLKQCGALDVVVRWNLSEANTTGINTDNAVIAAYGLWSKGMTVDRIYPCVCSIDDYEEGMIRNSRYGMPELIVSNAIKPHKQFWSVYCPKCGRGSKLDSFDSAYKALKAWNLRQANLYLMKERGIICESD